MTGPGREHPDARRLAERYKLRRRLQSAKFSPARLKGGFTPFRRLAHTQDAPAPRTPDPGKPSEEEAAT